MLEGLIELVVEALGEFFLEVFCSSVTHGCSLIYREIRSLF
jgi:hypothetical protein